MTATTEEFEPLVTVRLVARSVTIPPYPKADEGGGIGWITTMRVFGREQDEEEETER